MNDEQHDILPPRDCDICRRPMVLVSTLTAAGLFPMKRVYKCSRCKFAVADAASA